MTRSLPPRKWYLSKYTATGLTLGVRWPPKTQWARANNGLAATTTAPAAAFRSKALRRTNSANGLTNSASIISSTAVWEEGA
eukprot:CAMPEP_0204444546 /NCGR_PEP_ID=MMETSP0470-20130426/91181_1 /ASSEMBLY_ACC=CAM_ASM_000385 /TAXON_ID=2969 /ORGANISM="Oxyrrhis marina" /LENGTH=81 /DNA_ID=CAMNT_0051443933 /DNA_START=32 /DNA_END=277 /DNA_ORIENTATION=-